MAVIARNRLRMLALVVGALAVLAMPENCQAGDAGSNGFSGLLDDARNLLRDGSSRFGLALQDARKRVRDGSPDWLRLRSGLDPFDDSDYVDDEGATLVVQEDRADGADLLTIRFFRRDLGPLQTYAGAGINRTQYFDDLTGRGPALMNNRNRHSNVGAAAEAGAELRISERLRLSADVRWADLHENASALRSVYGPVVADPLTFGVNIGYRFR